MINNGQGAFGQRIPVTGRINAVAPNPLNPLGDVWVGSATGGVWHGAVSPTPGWQAVADDAPSLAVGDIELDSCTVERCATVWVGTGENSIRRDTQYGRGVLKFTWRPGLGRYTWTLLGEEHFALGSIARVRLDPRTADGPAKTLFVALSSGQTSNASHSTVTTEPRGPYGIWRSRNAGRTWRNVLASATPATDLEMDPQEPATLFAGLRHKGLFKSTDGGDSWRPIGNGIPAEVLAAADWPEIAVFRSAGMAQPILYAALPHCPHPHEKDVDHLNCTALLYKSTDGGALWAETLYPDPEAFPLYSYASYTHALIVHPTQPDTVWYGGIYLNDSEDGGQFFNPSLIGLHADQHEIAIWPDDSTLLGVRGYVGNDGGLAFGDGIRFSAAYQAGLAVTQFQSIAASPGADFLIGGTQDNGSNIWLGTDVWEHIDDGDAGATLIDLDDPGILYDTYFGMHLRRCALPNRCGFSWPEIANGIGEDEDVSWYAPLVQDPTPTGGQHPLYAATTRLYRSVDDGASWSLVTQGAAPGGTGTIPELDGIQNPISAVAVSPSNRNRLYIGYYDGQMFTTADAWAAHPAWTRADLGLPRGRPVTAIAVHPLNDRIALASFSGFGHHSIFATAAAGAAWLPVDASPEGELARNPVDSLLIEPRFPYRVWAGTDDGVWTSPLPLPGFGSWERSPGLPNVAVYDLEMAGDGVSVLAATHGRGVWRFSATPVARAHTVAAEGSPVWIAAAGFDPGEPCTLTLLAGGRVCATSDVDADGAALTTDDRGFLVAAKAGVYAPRPLAWACRGGQCAGGAACDVRQVRVTCGGRTAQAKVPVAWNSLDPQSTRLSVEAGEAGKAGSRGGTFTVTAKLRRTDGTAEVLCAGTVFSKIGETGEAALERAAEGLSENPECRQAGVGVKEAGRVERGGEDEGPKLFRLALEAPWQAGDRLVTELTATGPGSFTVDGYGAPARGRSIPARLTLSGRAAGGHFEITERSPLGTCTVRVETAAGEPAEGIAARLQDAFLAPDPALPDFRGEPCLPRQNPRDAERSGATLLFPLGRQVTVTSSDAGLGFTLGSGE
jgi:hypothetical protein